MRTTTQRGAIAAAPYIFTIVFFALWEAACRLFKVPPFFLPAPSVIAQAMVEYWWQLLFHSFHTLWMTLAGFAIAVVFGILLGIALGASRIVNAGTQPLLVGFNAIPKVAVVPILILWFGVGWIPPVMTAFLISFFPIVVNVATGLSTIEPELEDVTSGHLEVQNGDSSRANIRDLRNEKGVSGYDQPFNDTLSAVYQLPFGRGRRHGANWGRGIDAVLGGWQLTLINTATSGLPINITYSPNGQFQVTSIGLSQRPNVVGPLVTPEGSRTTTNYLDKNAITVPTDPAKPFGNLGRNAARGYGLFQMDLGLHKEFSVTERARLQFRGEAFNLTNQTNFQAPASNISSSNYGSITTTFPARQLQFALRLSF